MIYDSWILIIDFGSQYTKVLARRVRDLSVYCEVVDGDLSAVKLALKNNPTGIIFSGSPHSVYEDDYSAWSEIFEPDAKILGVCFGMQMMGHLFGGKVVHTSENREFGSTKISLSSSRLFDGIPSDISVWMSHGDHLTIAPDSFDISASSLSCPIVAISHQKNHWYAVQFHPEVTHTEYGNLMLKNFVLDICEAKQSWQASDILATITNEIKNQVHKDQKILIAVSGGVDSTVSAVILHQIFDDNLIPVMIDTGLLRKNEVAEVREIFSHLNISLNVVDASEYFLSHLAGADEPEQKRKIIGRCFIEKFEEFVRSQDIKYLAQGTIYPDIIESGSKSKHSETIKSHHNVGGLPADMKLELVEPLKHLFKDEVRRLGKLLGIPDSFLAKHPFPGPGLGVRILGEIKREYISILQRADYIFIEELKSADLYHSVSQAFCVFLPIKSVGVAGDSRKYSYVVSLRAVETTDFMTAKFSHINFDILEKISNKITNEIPEISRVVYDISSKPPATIEWE